MTFYDAVPKKSITMFIPSKDKYGYRISQHNQWTIDAVSVLSKLYGGATAHYATGGWQDNGYLVTEEVSVVTCYASPEAFEDKDKQESVIDFCKNMGRVLNQSEVGLVVDGKYLGIRDFERSDDK